jgi:hypothetical protein
MANERSILEREMERVELRPFTLDGFHQRRERKQRNHRIAAGVFGLVVAGVVLGGLVRVFGSEPTPADDRTPFLGRWYTSDLDGSTPTMTVRTVGETTVEIVVRDDLASVCSGAPSTMTGTGGLDDTAALVIPTPEYTCDDGSEPEALSGPPLEEQLRGLTFVLGAGGDTLTDNLGAVWTREPGAAPEASGSMWPQRSLEEIRQAQERADAGDPDYTWQVDPNLAAWPDSNPEEPWGSEVFQRFVREVLRWDGFTGFAIGGYVPQGAYSHHLAGVVFLRCAPGQTNPLYPNPYPDMPSEVRGCAPTIDDSRYETVRFDVEQEGRTGPSGIWVVTRWELVETAEPFSPLDLSPDWWERQVAQVTPPSDAEVTEFLQAFLGARVAGQGAEEYLYPGEAEGWPWPDGEVPLLYATTRGVAYERSEFERVQGPVWPTGWIEVRVRLFAGDGTEVEQSFVIVREEDGSLALVNGSPTGDLPTTEDGRSVAVPYSLLDGQVTFAAAPPWRAPYHGDDPVDPTIATLEVGDTCRGTGLCADNFVVVADPPIEIGCEPGRAPAGGDADALARSIRSNPDLEATAPEAVSIGGLDALRMDVVAAPGTSDCMPLALAENVGLLPTDRMRLYLLDLPGGSARVLAIATIARDPYGEADVPERQFERLLDETTPIVDSFDFHTG